MGLRHQELEMSWQPSLLSEKRKRGPPLGLRNLGNSCYLNSVLQCLTYTPPLANFCLNLQHSSLCDLARDCPFCILEKRIVRSLSLDSALDAPAKIQSCLRIFAEHFRCGRQEDAHEFLRYVIDACHNTCLRLKKVKRKGAVEAINNGSTSTSVVKEIFGGTLQSQVKCLSCGGESNKVDEIMDISLDILHSSSLKEAMHNFFQPELLDGNNKYKCENCKKLVAARKQMSILQSPNILVIQLKRFEGIFGGKIDKLIAFEEVLLLSSFMCKASQDPQPEYKLFGTIVHSGFSPDSGHYYAYIKDAMGRWYCCNDSYVSLSTLQEVLSEKVYILFYSRANQRPESANGTFASNAVKSRENGNEAYKGVKAVVPLKAFSARQSAEQLSWKNVFTISKVEKVLSNPQQKFSISGNSGCKGFSPTTNGNDVHKSHKIGKNGAVKDLAHKEKSDKEPVINRNDSSKNKRVDAVDKENILASTSTNENGDNHSIGYNRVKTDLREVNSTGSRMAAERGSHNTKLLNGSVYCHSDFSGSKRKSHEESCILFAQDSQSQAKVRELRKVLEEEAFSVLRSCDWSENVYSFMCSRKRVCAQEVGNIPRNFDLKKLLIADAKPTFISQIPESLKEDLIKRLSLFSKQKKESSGSSSTQVLLYEFSED